MTARIWNDWPAPCRLVSKRPQFAPAMFAKPNRNLLLITGLYLLLALATSVVVPLGESPDELDHFQYVQYVARQRAFPVMSPVFEENETMEANQPPLYYLLAVLAGGWIGRDQPLDFPLNSCFSYDPADPGRQTFYRH